MDARQPPKPAHRLTGSTSALRHARPCDQLRWRTGLGLRALGHLKAWRTGSGTSRVPPWPCAALGPAATSSTVPLRGGPVDRQAARRTSAAASGASRANSASVARSSPDLGRLRQEPRPGVGEGVQGRLWAKFPKAVAKITGDLEELLAFYAYPCEHWVHLQTTNPIWVHLPPCGTAPRSPRGPARGRWPGHGVQADRSRTRPLACRQRTPPRRPGPGRSHLQ